MEMTLTSKVTCQVSSLLDSNNRFLQQVCYNNGINPNYVYGILWK